MSERRASKRRRGRDEDVAVAMPRTNPRTAKCCMDLWIPSNLCCSGCINFAGSLKLPIEYSEKEVLEKIQSAILTRSQTHPSERYYCRQPWTWPEKQYVGKNSERWVSSVKEFVQKHHGRLHIIETIDNPTPPPLQSSSSSCCCWDPPCQPYGVFWKHSKKVS